MNGIRGCDFLEPVERWHNRSFGALYGDQSIFARREAFAALGGFRGLPLMEDVDFSRRLRRAGAVICSIRPSPPRRANTSHKAPWRTTFRNALLLALYTAGVSPERLHAWYYRGSAASAEARRGLPLPTSFFTRAADRGNLGTLARRRRCEALSCSFPCPPRLHLQRPNGAPAGRPFAIPSPREKAEILRERWASLPAELRTPNQISGRHLTHCGFTLGASFCSFHCTHCYLPKNANDVPFPSLAQMKEQIDANRRSKVRAAVCKSPAAMWPTPTGARGGRMNSWKSCATPIPSASCRC